MVSMTTALNAYGNQMKLAGGAESATAGNEKTGASFSDFLEKQVQDFISTQNNAEQAKVATVTGTGDVTDLVTAIANAELALNTIVTIRDKAIAAYQDIIRMPM